MAGQLALAFVALGLVAGSVSASPAGCYNHGECLGGTLLDTGLGVSSLEACLSQCAGQQGCEAVTYFPGRHLCLH